MAWCPFQDSMAKVMWRSNQYWFDLQINWMNRHLLNFLHKYAPLICFILLMKHKNVYFPYDFSTLKQLSSSVPLVSQGTQKFVNLGQWHHCWWPSDVKSHDISSHGIDLALLEYSAFSTTRAENKYYEVKFYSKGTWSVIHIISLDKLPAINWLFMCVNAQKENIYGLMQDCSISIANAMEILQSCTKPSIWKPSLPILCVKVVIDYWVTLHKEPTMWIWPPWKFIFMKAPSLNLHLWGKCSMTSVFSTKTSTCTADLHNRWESWLP